MKEHPNLQRQTALQRQTQTRLVLWLRLMSPGTGVQVLVPGGIVAVEQRESGSGVDPEIDTDEACSAATLRERPFAIKENPAPAVAEVEAGVGVASAAEGVMVIDIRLGLDMAIKVGAVGGDADVESLMVPLKIAPIEVLAESGTFGDFGRGAMVA